jgi:putative ABC transport system substrate-binding protein
MVSRRRFLQGVSANVLAVPVVAEAQPGGRLHRIGLLGNSSSSATLEPIAAFRQGLRDLGWVEGQTIAIDYRWAEGQADRIPALMSELVRLKSDVIVVSGSAAVRAAQQVTSTVPIVIAAILVDPVSAGFVASLSHPGGNITGLASQYQEVVTKQLQLLTEAIPGVARLVLLWDASAEVRPALTLTPALDAASKLGVKARVLKVRAVHEFEGAFRSAQEGQAQAVHVLPSPFFNAHRGVLVKLAERYQLPAMYEFREYPQDGGLMSYGVDLPDMYRRAARYVDRILKGSRPADLPIERPTKFELVINLKTAKALGLTIPPSLLLRADQVIE